MGFLDSLGEMVGEFRSKTYPTARNKLARTVLDLGGASTGADAKKILHEGGNYALTKKFGTVLPPWLAANTSDLMYLGNEAFTGALAKASGRPFFSDYGFRWKDVAMNRAGQDRAIQELKAEKKIRDAMEAQREWENPVPFGGKE
jgi:hypothetical protein